jgi:uncharacterized membrane protein
MTELVSVFSIGTLLLLGFAYLTMVFYDIPIRKYLTDKRNTKNAPYYLLLAVAGLLLFFISVTLKYKLFNYKL